MIIFYLERQERASQVALVVKNLPANAGSSKRHRFDPWVGKMGRWARQPTPVFLPGESHGQRTWRSTVHGSQRVRHDWRDSACMHAWDKNRLAELIYFRREGYSLLFPVPPVPILLFPVKRGTERLCGTPLGEEISQAARQERALDWAGTASRGAQQLACQNQQLSGLQQLWLPPFPRTHSLSFDCEILSVLPCPPLLSGSSFYSRVRAKGLSSCKLSHVQLTQKSMKNSVFLRAIRYYGHFLAFPFHPYPKAWKAEKAPWPKCTDQRGPSALSEDQRRAPSSCACWSA